MRPSEENKVALCEAVPESVVRRRPALVERYDLADEEDGPDLRAYWRVLVKRRWTIVSGAVALFTLALIATLKEKPVYRATALVEIQKENPDILTVQELFQMENVSDTYLETQYKVLQSETLARRVVRELHLDQVKEFGGLPDRRLAQGGVEAGNGAAEVLGERGVLGAFASRLSVEPVPRSRLVRLSIESQDPQLAAKAVNALAANYIEENLETRWQATQKASEWLSEQLRTLKARLEKSEDDLQLYAQANGLLFLESNNGQTENIVDERLRQLQDELTKAQADRYAKESLYWLVQAGDYSSLPGVQDSKTIQDLTLRLAELERQKAELSSVFSEAYPKVQEIEDQIAQVQAFLTKERDQTAERITNEYKAAVRLENLVRQAFQEQRQEANVAAGRAVQHSILKREVETNKQLYEGLLQRLKEAGVSAGLKASNIRVVDPAVPPSHPVKPRVLINLAGGTILGLLFGVSLCFLLERMDNTLKNADDIERFLGVPMLGFVPALASLRSRRARIYGISECSAATEGHLEPAGKKPGKSWVRIDSSNGNGHSALTEAFGGLRTSVLLSTAGQPPKSLTVASVHLGEGKTTIICNLSISLAQLGKRVLLIDGDMRRPAIHKLFGLHNHSQGVVSYLTGQAEWRSLIQTTGTRNLDCLVCGPVPPNPSELISSERMQELVREATREYDFVLLDSPPILNVADGRIVATLVEGTILVVKGGSTPREAVQRARSLVHEVGAHVIGAVLNNVDLHSDSYSYGYYYREAPTNDGQGGDGAREA